MASRRSSGPFYLLVGLILAALPLAYVLTLERPVPQMPAPEPIARQHELEVAEASGAVQVRKSGGEWIPARPGDVLKASDGVRTGDGSYAVLMGGEAYEVKMEPGTEVAVSELSESISKLLLEGGMATAKVKGQARHTFEVRAANADAVARTADGTFAISSNGAGTVAVGTEAGEVQFIGAGKTVVVRAGQHSIVRPGQGPTEPQAIPSSLLLKVQLPEQHATGKPRLTVAGQTQPGAMVEVGGKVVRVDEGGSFSHTVTLSEGPNALEVRARFVGGAPASSVHRVTLDTQVRKPSIDPDFWTKQAP